LVEKSRFLSYLFYKVTFFCKKIVPSIFAQFFSQESQISGVSSGFKDSAERPVNLQLMRVTQRQTDVQADKRNSLAERTTWRSLKTGD